MKYVITENGRVVVFNDDTPKQMSSFYNTGAKTRPMIKWPTFEETCIFYTIGKQTISIDRDFGLLVGLYIGDGWCDKNISSPKMHIANVDPGIISTYRDLVNRYLRDTNIVGYYTGVQSHDYYEQYDSAHGKFSISIPPEVRDDMLTMFGHGAYNKKIPLELFDTPTEFRWGLLSGLIDTDGCISHRSVVKSGKMQQSKYAQYATQSWDLAQGVQKLCMSLGINASCSIFYRDNIPEFTVLFSSIDMYRVRNKLSCASGKHKVLDEFTFGDAPNPKDTIPFDDKLHKMMLSHNGYDNGGVIFNNAKRRGYIVRETFMRYAPPEAVQYMDGMYGLDSRWETVYGVVYLPDDHTRDDIVKLSYEVKSENKKVS